MAGDEEVTEETTEEESQDEEINKASALLSPEAVVMFPIAIVLDLFGLALTIIWLLTLFGVATLEIPEIVNWASDGAGFAFFGTWLLFRAPFKGTEGASTGALAESVVQRRMAMKSTAKEMEKTMTTAKKGMGRGLRFGIAFLGEVITLVGALPFWSWFVYSELKS